ncbi:DUF72 domain-containing protein [Marinobacter orientalis]|uniref:DUF72 domain-containing protein n=1 Tax=Marinobacter orientalis TaxID=1928859 RepID=A0A7Y0WSF5_9GAMM|nr:DUF72 domain-containing protein [Marinobacter orientalis]NMT63878.1 DUF72 domain-containing protein [Marinobacter orientalis]TGX49978.1 DUF72 domain-containing protein [Marinobacter orientalis]
MSKNGGIRIGTSGWNFDSWRGSFYPEGLGAEGLLQEYARSFDTVELNNSFYQLPDKTSVNGWLEAAPGGFLFSVKASRYLTHMKKLKDAGEGLDRFLAAVEPFGSKLGPLIFQLPPRWRVNVSRLTEFLDQLPPDYRYAFEFRDTSWLCDEVYEVLTKYNAALCYYDYKGYRSPPVATADFVYARLHGPEEEAYTGSYDGRALAGFARRFVNWEQEGRDVFCYFDNDDKACAPRDAQRLLESVRRQKR